MSIDRAVSRVSSKAREENRVTSNCGRLDDIGRSTGFFSAAEIVVGRIAEFGAPTKWRCRNAISGVQRASALSVPADRPPDRGALSQPWLVHDLLLRN